MFKINEDARKDGNLVQQPENDLPSGVEQLKDFRYNELLKAKVSNDIVNNIRALRLTSMKQFIHLLVAEPNLQIHLANDSLIELTNDLMKRNMVLLYYDTTFNLADIFVTPVVARNLHFVSNPIYPVAFLLHERKYESVHLQFLVQTISNLLNFNTGNVSFVHDREPAIVNSVRKCLELHGLTKNQFFCMNHIYTNIKMHVNKRSKLIKKKIEKVGSLKPIKVDVDKFIKEEGLILENESEEIESGKSSDESTNGEAGKFEELRSLAIFKKDLYNLRKNTASNDFDSKVNELSTNWNEKEKEYFNKNIRKDLKTNVGNITEADVYDEFNNVGESCNAYLKKFYNNRKQSIDALVLGLFNFTVTFLDKFNQGYKGFGKLVLKKEFQHLKTKQYKTPFKLDIESELMEIKGEFKLIESSVDLPRNLGQLYLAEYILKNLEIKQAGNSFIVPTPNSDEKYVVEFANNVYKCHCPLRGNCCHRMAIELKLNKKTTANPFDIDLMKNKRKTEKRSGQKGGNELDCRSLFKKVKTDETKSNWSPSNGEFECG